MNSPPPRETTPEPTNISCRNLFLLECDTHPGSWGFWGSSNGWGCLFSSANTSSPRAPTHLTLDGSVRALRPGSSLWDLGQWLP